MRLFALFLLAALSLIAGDAVERKAVEAKCTLHVVMVNPNIGNVPTTIRTYNLARCEDAEFKGGGVVIRHITDELMGTWSIRYYPAHKIDSVSVTPKSF